MIRFIIKNGLFMMAIFFCGLGETRAVDFRIENRVFVGGEKEPQSRSLTLFRGGNGGMISCPSPPK